MTPRATLIALVLLAAAAGSSRSDEAPAVNYISQEHVYLNVGRRAGLAIGARVRVLRDGQLVAVLVVEHVSSHSASCVIVEAHGMPRVGDHATFKAAPAPAPSPAAPVAGDEPSPAPSWEVAPKHRPQPRLSGYVALESFLQRDRRGALSSVQPAVAARVIVSNVWGGELRLRHRSRLYHRPDAPGADEWTHRLTELAYMVSGGGGTEYGIGRMIVPYVYGLGPVDGAFFSTPVGRRWRLGLAGGLDASSAGTSFEEERSKVGVFAALEAGSPDATRLALTGVLSGSYADGAVSREFGYLQAVVDVGQRLHFYQSTEIDINRGWRRQVEGESITFSNWFLTASANPWPFVGVDLNYDARRGVRDADTFATPDSLFDDRRYQGYSGALSFALPHGVRVRGNAGVRLRDSSEETNRYYAVTASAVRLPWVGHSLTLRYAVSETPYLTGYRPSLSYRFPVTRRVRASAGLGSTRYEQAFDTTTETYVEAGARATFGRRYFAALDARAYSGEAADSFQLFTEIGLDL
jgi:hypothetical protein